MTRNWMTWLPLIGLMALVGAWGCSDDDDDASDGGPDGGDADADTDTDTDTDSDTDVTWDGTLGAEQWGGGVSVDNNGVSTQSRVSVSAIWVATDGNVHNVELTEIRVYLAATDELIFTTPSAEDIEIVGAPFDGTVMQGAPMAVSYLYESPVQNGFQNYCDQEITVEFDAHYNEGEVLTLEAGGVGSGNTVDCVEV